MTKAKTWFGLQVSRVRLSQNLSRCGVMRVSVFCRHFHLTKFGKIATGTGGSVFLEAQLQKPTLSVVSSIMLKRALGSSTWSLLAQSQLRSQALSRSFASDKHTSNVDEDELNAARRWLAKFDAETIPRNICEVSFSRSSGPGGQNVNKYSSLSPDDSIHH